MAKKASEDRKSVPSLTMTSLMLVSSDPICSRLSRGRGRSGLRALTLDTPVHRMPPGKILRTGAGRKGDRKSGPERQARQVDHHDIADHHQQHRPRPGAGDDII